MAILKQVGESFMNELFKLIEQGTRQGKINWSFYTSDEKLHAYIDNTNLVLELTCYDNVPMTLSVTIGSTRKQVPSSMDEISALREFILAEIGNEITKEATKILKSLVATKN
jgi:hypothetical protein